MPLIQLGRDAPQRHDPGGPNVVDHWHHVLSVTIGLGLPRSHSSLVSLASVP
jgi:hypothetical protein